LSFFAVMKDGGFHMATMNVSLPDPMKDWVEAQVSTDRYSNASDYVRDLIRRDQERTGKLAELRKLITEGIKSGVSARSIHDLLKTVRERAAGLRGIMAYRTTAEAVQDIIDIYLGDGGNSDSLKPSGITRD
jgi:antitoxin ParD1/3/4